MKTKRLKLLGISLLILPLCTVLLGAGCQKKDEKCTINAINGPEDNIIGKWKLVKGEEVFYNPRTVDYSCNNVIYQFKTDGVLIITSDIVDIIGFGTGKYSYEFILTDKGSHTLKVDNSQGGCSILGSDLTINYAYLDGPILYLIRVQ